ncbi:MAG: sugar ABC transporter permease [Verrucomicrobia bacterium]|nr:sugar ABC transporter permease [Verrucomicrobiota bacterium]
MAHAEKKTYSTGAWLFIGPAFIVLLLVGIVPLIFAFWTSLQEFVLSKAHLKGAWLGIWPIYDAKIIGLQHYFDLFSNQSFKEALGRSFFFLLVNLPIQMALGLAIALVLHRPGNEITKGVARVCLVIPLATTFAVVGLMGRLLFNDNFGLVSYVCQHVFGQRLEWLADSQLAFVSVSLMDIWQWTPFCALVLYSSLTMVPPEIEEAAKLETDQWWHVLWKVQLPFLLPGLTAILILRTADILKMFDVVFTMTRGGPGSATELISIYIQRIGFRAFEQGLASAQAIVLLILTIILSRIYIRFVYREV